MLITRLRPAYDNIKYEFLLAKTVFYGESITVVEFWKRLPLCV